MRIGIISDTHDNLTAIQKAMNVFNKEDVELVLHAGDFCSPFTLMMFKELNCRFIGVFGNNDGDRLMLKKMSDGKIFNSPHEINIGDKKAIISHELPLDALIASQYYDLIVYGHNHQVDTRVVDKTIIINPGECCGWLSGSSTVAICELDEKKTKIVTL